eukprot:1352332-Amorphochlora_amoeboformis.AAC.1
MERDKKIEGGIKEERVRKREREREREMDGGQKERRERTGVTEGHREREFSEHVRKIGGERHRALQTDRESF